MRKGKEGGDPCEIPYNPSTPLMLATTHPPFLSLCGGTGRGQIHVRSASTPQPPPHVRDPSFPFLREKEKGGDVCEIPFILFNPSGSRR